MRILILAIALLSILQADAATVTGRMGLITGNDAAGQKLVFSPPAGWRIVGSKIVAPQSATATTDAGGAFSVSLVPGDYILSVNSAPALAFRIAADVDSVDLTQPATAARAYFLGDEAALFMVKTSAGDTNAAYLGSKIVAGLNVTVTTNDAGALVIAAAGGGEGGPGLWGAITGTLSDQADLQAALGAKADTGHTHPISDVISLETALDAKAALVHLHAADDISSGVLSTDRLPLAGTLTPGIVPLSPALPDLFLMTDELGKPTWTNLANVTLVLGNIRTLSFEPSSATVTNQLKLLSSDLLQAGTNVIIDLSSKSRRWIIATNDLNFTAINAVDGATVDIGIFAGTTNRNLTFDTNWVWFGAPAPTVLASNKFARFTVQYWAGLTNYHCFYSPSF